MIVTMLMTINFARNCVLNIDDDCATEIDCLKMYDICTCLPAVSATICHCHSCVARRNPQSCNSCGERRGIGRLYIGSGHMWALNCYGNDCALDEKQRNGYGEEKVIVLQESGRSVGGTYCLVFYHFSHFLNRSGAFR